ncbi:MAG: YbbR-like domain-containing protein, partial [bacterium]
MNKQLYVILICFTISLSFWLLLALSHDYPTSISFPVKYINLPGKKVLMNEMPSEISIQVNTSGFKIMSFGFKKVQEPVEIDLATSLHMPPTGPGIVAIPTRNFLSDFSNELGKDISIIGFSPDSIVFNFSDVISKNVPVVLSLKATYEKQYDSTGSPRIFPPMVEVFGPPQLIDSLYSITTEPIKLSNLKETVKMKAKLIENRLLSYNVKEVEFVLPVEKYTEGITDVEIHPVNVVEGYSLKTFPDKVKVRYLVALSQYNKVDNSTFDVVVDASGLGNRNPSKLNV